MTGSEDGSNSATLGVASLQAAARQHGSWRRSSFCGTNACVAVAIAGPVVYIRSTSDSDPPIKVTRAEWDAFVQGVKAGEFDA